MSGNLVVNGAFESNVTGWVTDGRPAQIIDRRTPGRDGSRGAARLTTTKLSAVGLNENTHSITSTVRGETVEATAWVRALRPGLSGRLRIREVAGNAEVSVGRTPFALTGTGWQQVTVSFVTAQRGSAIDLTVQGWEVGSNQGLLVDDVTLVRTTSGPAPTTPPVTTPPVTTPPVTTPPATTPPATTPPVTTPPATTPPATTPPATTPPATTPPATTPPPTNTDRALMGMSAPANTWDQRVSEVGPGLQARRIFYTSFSQSLSLAERALADGMYPVLSYKTGGYSWSQVASGAADAELRALAGRLAALPGPVFVAVHHEPAKDGLAADWAAMQVHALPILGVDPDVKVGVIGNGWWFSDAAQGYSDAELATYFTPGVRAVSDVIAADTYQDSATTEDAGPKIRNMGSWARRVGGVRGLGVGEFNGHTAASITNATNALRADPLFEWGCLWNNTIGIATVLTGDRLTAFRVALAAWDN